MNPLAGSSFELDFDEVLVGSAGDPRLLVGHSGKGQRWLVALTAQSGQARRWLCAPASDLAIECVRSGQASPADLFRHSSTGTVEVIAVGADGRCSASVRLCAQLNDDELPSIQRLASPGPPRVSRPSRNRPPHATLQHTVEAGIAKGAGARLVACDAVRSARRSSLVATAGAAGRRPAEGS